MSAQPPIQTTSVEAPLDISHTEDATHVYIKSANPKSLCPRFEGPHPRSPGPLGRRFRSESALMQMDLHWSSCRIARMREEVKEMPRPNIGRKQHHSPPKSVAQPTENNSVEVPSPSGGRGHDLPSFSTDTQSVSSNTDRQQTALLPKARKFKLTLGIIEARGIRTRIKLMQFRRDNVIQLKH